MIAMLSKSDAAKALRTHFKKHLVATLPELVEVLRNPSRSSVYRRLKTLGYLASYTHAGAHYTLSKSRILTRRACGGTRASASPSAAI